MSEPTGLSQVEIRAQIERIFETATAKDARLLQKRLDALIAQVLDKTARQRYQMAADELPDMLKHLDTRGTSD